jgi:hypothetical protein
MPANRLTFSLLLACAASLAPSALAQDAYEPNDICAMPAPLTPGFIDQLTIGPDDDHYLITLPANADVRIDARDGGGVALDVELYEAGCGTQLASGTNAGLRYFDCGGAARDVVLRVPGASGVNAPYTLDVSVTAVVDDSSEENDTCTSGSLIALDSFTTPGLVDTACDEDYFVARLQSAGTELQIDLLFAHAQGDVDVELWDLGCTTLLASSTSMDDNESVRYVNTTSPSAAQAVVIRVFMKNGEGWADYALTACFAAPPLSHVGEQACAGVTNSTGRPATLCGRGSNVASSNGVYLYVVDLPMGSAGYFVTSPDFQLTLNPGGSQGNLCLGAAGRYSYDILFTTAVTTAVFYQPDLMVTPVAGGSFTAITAGMRQYWQYWYRDSVGGVATSNFSSTLEIDFQ